MRTVSKNHVMLEYRGCVYKMAAWKRGRDAAVPHYPSNSSYRKAESGLRIVQLAVSHSTVKYSTWNFAKLRR